MDIAIIDYGAGNTTSVKFAFERIGINSILTKDKTIIKNADKVIFPGVGEASSAMSELKNSGLDQLIPTLKQPVLGICLGMQLMCNYSEEGQTDGLGIFPINVQRFDNSVKIPKVGWNNLYAYKSKLFNSIEQNSYAYFVHSYYVPLSIYTDAKAFYGVEYSAALQNLNFYACQFHPEKSSEVGEQILRNFINL
jgi:glutamine amidotransferase